MESEVLKIRTSTYFEVVAIKLKLTRSVTIRAGGRYEDCEFFITLVDNKFCFCFINLFSEVEL